MYAPYQWREQRDVYSISTYLRQHIPFLWTHGQSAYASIVRIIRTEDEKKGIDFPTKVSLIEERKKERRVKKHVVEALIAT